MKPFAGLLLLLAAGCTGFDEPTSDRLSGLPLRPPVAEGVASRRTTMVRFQMSIDSPWLAGEYEGVAVAKEFAGEARLRAHLWGDLGPRAADLLVTPDRVVGYFPQIREGIDCSIPRESTPHPLLFMGASLAQELLAPETAASVTGVREEPDGTWLRLHPFFPGTEVHRLMSRVNPGAKMRRFWWMIGVHWEETWTSPSECRITAPNLSIRVKILERKERESGIPGADMGLMVPDDVRIVAGSRK